MKNFLVVCGTVFSTLIMLLPSVPELKDADGSFTFCLGNDSSCCKFATYENLDYIEYFKLFDVSGESAHGVSKTYIEDFLDNKKAEKVFSEVVGNTVSNYYYSPQIPVYKSINGKKVNIQTASTGSYNVIGCPMIFGGY